MLPHDEATSGGEVGVEQRTTMTVSLDLGLARRVRLEAKRLGVPLGRYLDGVIERGSPALDGGAGGAYSAALHLRQVLPQICVAGGAVGKAALRSAVAAAGVVGVSDSTVAAAVREMGGRSRQVSGGARVWSGISLREVADAADNG